MRVKKATIEELVKSITAKMRCINLFIDGYEGEFSWSCLHVEYPMYNMMMGMLRTLEIMGIAYELKYETKSPHFAGIEIAGETFPVDYGRKK